MNEERMFELPIDSTWAESYLRLRAGWILDTNCRVRVD
jgi:hypothetical protein